MVSCLQLQRLSLGLAGLGGTRRGVSTCGIVDGQMQCSCLPVCMCSACPWPWPTWEEAEGACTLWRNWSVSRLGPCSACLRWPSSSSTACCHRSLPRCACHNPAITAKAHPLNPILTATSHPVSVSSMPRCASQIQASLPTLDSFSLPRCGLRIPSSKQGLPPRSTPHCRGLPFESIFMLKQVHLKRSIFLYSTSIHNPVLTVKVRCRGKRALVLPSPGQSLRCITLWFSLPLVLPCRWPRRRRPWCMR